MATSKQTLFFIDFDGVMCDSLPECWVSSWIGYHRLIVGTEPSFTDLRDRHTFDSYRPFIRRGADYLLLHRCIQENIHLQNQRDFDAQEAAAGEEMEVFHEAFYRVREELLEQDREYWLSLNTIFPRLVEPAKSWAREPRCYILSTKKAEFIREILTFSHIDWPLDRIIYSGTERKLDLILGKMGEMAIQEACFFDDQVDHFPTESMPGIRCYLADWGYVKAEWLETSPVPVINQEEMIELISDDD